MSAGWEEIWERRRLDPDARSTLARLMAADGLDTGFGDVSETSWRAAVRRVAAKLDLEPGDTVFEVGCGAGAFLYDLYERGVVVAGIDRSAALAGYAQAAMPGGRFSVRDAAELDPAERADAVVSFGVFMYFPSLDYARRVVEAMAGCARRAVSILDVPDAATRDEAIARRIEVCGGPEAYAERYAGLDHLYFERDWLASALAGTGLAAVETEDQAIDGYENSRYRFNVFGFVERK